MNSTLLQTSARGSHGQNVSADLIADWATRVIGIWERSRTERPSDARSDADLADACLVRDHLNNQLTMMYPDADACAEESLETLRDADAFFLQFTVESNTAEALSRPGHYAHRSQWWWRRHPRLQAA